MLLDHWASSYGLKAGWLVAPVRWFFALWKVLSIVTVHSELISKLCINITSHKQICNLEPTLSCQHRTMTRHQGWKVTREVTQGVLLGLCPSHIPAPGQPRGPLVDDDCPAQACEFWPWDMGPWETWKLQPGFACCHIQS